MIIIDTHAHLVPQHFPDRPGDVPTEEWPVMVPMEDGRARLLLGETEFRVFEPAYWDMAARIEHMDREGVTIQVLSPLPELFGYWFSLPTTRALARHLNATIAAAIGQAPDRLAGLGTVPLQDVEAAVDMLHEVKGLGLRGILVASNVNGVSLADPRFDPVFATCEALDLAVSVHGYRPAGTDRFVGSPLLPAIVGVPQDAMAVVASFIMTDILGRFPALRLNFVHGGGAFGAVLHRLDHVWREFPQMQQAVATAPSDYVRRFFFDSVTFGADYLRYLIGAYGSDGMMAGSDGPTPIGQRDLAGFIGRACDGDMRMMEKLSWRNAARFLNLDDMVSLAAERRTDEAGRLQ